MNVELMVQTWQSLIRPRRIEVDDGLTETRGQFECAPLDLFFGASGLEKYPSRAMGHGQLTLFGVEVHMAFLAAKTVEP